MNYNDNFSKLGPLILDSVKVNLDGEARGHPSHARDGFICRDSMTTVMTATTQPLGITTALMVETWVMLLALRTTKDKQWTKMYF